MTVSRTGALLALALAGAMGLSACGTDDNSSAGGTTSNAANDAAAVGGGTSLSGAGSSFQDPMEQQWSKDFAGRHSGAQVNYQAVGSGAGIQQFGQGTVDYAGSDVVMKSDEQAAADKRCGSPALHIPVTAGGVGVTWNLPGVTSLQFSPDTLADIFQGDVTTWNDEEIATDNPGRQLPGTPITVVYRSDASGTTAIFTGFLAATSATWKLGSDKTVSWPVGQGAQKNQGVSAAVAQTPGAITYTEQAFAQQQELPLARIRNGGGAYVGLSTSSVTEGLRAATLRGSGHDRTYQVNFRPTAKDAYPIASFSYAIVCSAYPAGFGRTDLLREFLTYALTTGQQTAPSLGFSPLPTQVAAEARQAVESVH